MSIVFLNGNFLPEDEATISPLDRGFVFGDGVYEVIPVYGANLFRIEEHLQRLDNSLSAIRLKNPYTNQQWLKLFNSLIKENGNGDQSLYLQITRGKAVRDHAIPNDVVPTVFMMSSALKSPTQDVIENGISVVSCDDFRWTKCHIKSISLIANVLLRQYAVDNGAEESILIRDGKVTEGAASNIFVVVEGTLITPPKGPLLLPGITRDLILEIAQQNNIASAEATLTVEQLNQASEIMLSSSTKEILPVTQLDDNPVGNGKPGPIYNKLYSLYQVYKNKLRKGELV